MMAGGRLGHSRGRVLRGTLRFIVFKNQLVDVVLESHHELVNMRVGVGVMGVRRRVRGIGRVSGMGRVWGRVW